MSLALIAAIARSTNLTFCSEIRGHLPANCAFSSVVGDGGHVVMTSPATPPTPRGAPACCRVAPTEWLWPCQPIPLDTPCRLRTRSPEVVAARSDARRPCDGCEARAAP